jgi:hypothetical protein
MKMAKTSQGSDEYEKKIIKGLRLRELKGNDIFTEAASSGPT